MNIIFIIPTIITNELIKCEYIISFGLKYEGIYNNDNANRIKIPLIISNYSEFKSPIGFEQNNNNYSNNLSYSVNLNNNNQLNQQISNIHNSVNNNIYNNNLINNINNQQNNINNIDINSNLYPNNLYEANEDAPPAQFK